MAESANIALASMPPKYPFKCGSYESYRSELCREREAHNQTLALSRSRLEDVMELQDIKRKHEHEELVAAQENDRLKQERDEARHKLELCMAANSDVARIAKERDEAREQNAKLREIADALGGALERLDVLYRSEQDPEAPMPRPDWLRRPLQMIDAELDRLKEGAK
jgi:hypothetical protein